jgi:hypothetical protein
MCHVMDAFLLTLLINNDMLSEQKDMTALEVALSTNQHEVVVMIVKVNNILR